MKPYQSAWDVAQYMRKYKYNKPINIDAVTEYFRAGMQRELEKIKGTSIDDLLQYNETLTWSRELNTWLRCWYSWIYD